MDKQTAIVVTVGLGLALLLIASNAGAMTDTGTLWNPSPPDPALPPDTVPAVDNLGALLATIRHFESNDDYAVLYGGARFSGNEFPNVRVQFHNPRKAGTGNNDYSTAAGAYQINKPTFDQFGPPYGVNDFSPASQDQIAANILTAIGAVSKLDAGDVQGAILTASKRWASLPGSSAGQNPVTMLTAVDYFNQVSA